MIKKPQLSVPDFLIGIAREIFSLNELPEKSRAETAVTLRRRLRSAKKSDLLGKFHPLTPNTWVGDGPEQEYLMNMYGFHIVKPVVRANQSAMVQAEVECTVEPTNKNPRVAGVASIGRGIYKFINNHPDYWSSNYKSQIAQQCHTDPGYYTRVYHDPDAESLVNIVLDEYSDTPQEQPGEYACRHCGWGGEMFSEDMDLNVDGTMQCLNGECDQSAEILKAPETAGVDRFKSKQEFPAGNIVQEVVSAAFQIRIDERKTKNGEIRRADWLEHHFLMYEDDLQAMAPHFDIGSPGAWSYPIQWEYALETGVDFRLQPWRHNGAENRRSQYEVRRIYLRPSRYRHYRAPADFTLDRGDGHAALNRKGEPMLTIRAGERLIDKFPKGFWFFVSDDRLFPCMDKCDLRDEWSYGGFLNDSASVWYQPAVELEELQRAANNLYTIEMQHLETSSITTTFFDREWFDSDDFERGLSPTKENTHIAVGDDISRHMKTVVPPNLTGVMQGMEFIRSLIPDVSGVQPAAVGAPSHSEPFAAQRLQRQASLGLLTPAQQSMASVKATVTMQHLKLCQKTKPIEWFYYIGTMYGEEWKQQDIEAFLESNLDLDVVVDWQRGTEVPTTLLEQEMKYRQYLTDISQVAQFVQGVVTPEMVTEIASKYAGAAGLDLDFGNVEADLRLADSRYQKIKEWLAANKNEGLPDKELVDTCMADRDFMPSPGEDHETHIEFYNDHLRALRAADYPDYHLVDACTIMIDRHQEGIKAQKQTKSEAEVEGHAPEIAAQVAAAQAQAQAAAQAEQEKLQAEAAAREQDNQAALARQSMIEQGKAEKAAADREMKLLMHHDEVALKAAEIAKPEAATVESPEEPFDPMRSIIESIDYSELAPAAQADVVGAIGLPTAGIKDVHQSNIEKARIAATKARASQSRNGARSK